MNDDILLNEVKEVKVLVIDLVKQGAIHNQILLEHEKRSTQLETRLTPIESDFNFKRRLFHIGLSLLGVSGTVIALFKML